MSIFILLAAISGVVTKGRTVENILFNDRNDTYMDFFNSLMYENKPYENKVIYPPLANVFYYLISSYIPRNTYAQGSFVTRSSQMGRLLMGIYITLSTLSFIYAVLKLKKGSLEEITLFTIILLLSTPFIFLLERGNLIFLTCSFIMLYIYGYDSNKTLIKHLSFISLSIAAAFKIYPAVFGLLLLKEKRWKDAGICICYGVSIFVLPIIFLGGFSNFPLFISNLIGGANSLISLHSKRYYLSLNNLYLVLDKYANIHVLNNYSLYITLSVLIVGILIILFVDYNEKWKKLAIPTILMISIPSFSGIYAMVYITIPLIYFLDKKEFYKKDLFYMFLFILMLSPFHIKFVGYIESLGLYIMLAMLYVEGIILAWQKSKEILLHRANK